MPSKKQQTEIDNAMAAAREIKDSRSKEQKKRDAEKEACKRVLRKDIRPDLEDGDMILQWTGSDGVWIASVRLEPNDRQYSGVKVILD